MPKLYAGQIDVQGEGGADIVPLPNSGSVVVAAAGAIETEVVAKECEEAGTSTDTELTDNKVKENEEGRYNKLVAENPIADSQSGVIDTTVGEENIPQAKSGIVDTETSDGKVKEAELGITDRYVIPYLALQETQGTININLEVTPSCRINE